MSDTVAHKGVNIASDVKVTIRSVMLITPFEGSVNGAHCDLAKTEAVRNNCLASILRSCASTRRDGVACSRSKALI